MYPVGTKTQFDIPARQTTWDGGIDSLELIPGLFKGLQIRALAISLHHVRPIVRLQ
jgi:hypothetical protein